MRRNKNPCGNVAPLHGLHLQHKVVCVNIFINNDNPLLSRAAWAKKSLYLHRSKGLSGSMPAINGLRLSWSVNW